MSERRFGLEFAKVYPNSSTNKPVEAILSTSTSISSKLRYSGYSILHISIMNLS